MICNFLSLRKRQTGDWLFTFTHSYGFVTLVDLEPYVCDSAFTRHYLLKNYDCAIFCNRVKSSNLSQFDIGKLILAAEDSVRGSKYNFHLDLIPWPYFKFFFEDANAALMFKMQL